LRREEKRKIEMNVDVFYISGRGRRKKKKKKRPVCCEMRDSIY
jgi:hypothetical protein